MTCDPFKLVANNVLKKQQQQQQQFAREINKKKNGNGTNNLQRKEWEKQKIKK